MFGLYFDWNRGRAGRGVLDLFSIVQVLQLRPMSRFFSLTIGSISIWGKAQFCEDRTENIEMVKPHIVDKLNGIVISDKCVCSVCPETCEISCLKIWWHWLLVISLYTFLVIFFFPRKLIFHLLLPLDECNFNALLFRSHFIQTVVLTLTINWFMILYVSLLEVNLCSHQITQDLGYSLGCEVCCF